MACWMTVENFDFGPNTCHKKKEDGVSNKGGRKQVAMVGVDSKGAGEGGVDSRVGEGKGKRPLRQ